MAPRKSSVSVDNVPTELWEHIWHSLPAQGPLHPGRDTTSFALACKALCVVHRSCITFLKAKLQNYDDLDFAERYLKSHPNCTRLEVLASSHAVPWLGLLAASAPGPLARITELHLSEPICAFGAAQLAPALPQLRSLRLHEDDPQGEALAQFATACPHLSGLHLSLDTLRLPDNFGITKLTTLTSLTLAWSGTLAKGDVDMLNSVDAVVEDNSLESIRHLINLQCLELTGWRSSDCGSRSRRPEGGLLGAALAHVAPLTQLTALHFRCNMLPCRCSEGASAATLRPLAGLKRLEELSLIADGAPSCLDHRAMAELSPLTRLRRLDVWAVDWARLSEAAAGIDLNDKDQAYSAPATSAAAGTAPSWHMPCLEHLGVYGRCPRVEQLWALAQHCPRLCALVHPGAAAHGPYLRTQPAVLSLPEPYFYDDEDDNVDIDQQDLEATDALAAGSSGGPSQRALEAASRELQQRLKQLSELCTRGLVTELVVPECCHPAHALAAGALAAGLTGAPSFRGIAQLTLSCGSWCTRESAHQLRWLLQALPDAAALRLLHCSVEVMAALPGCCSPQLASMDLLFRSEEAMRVDEGDVRALLAALRDTYGRMPGAATLQVRLPGSVLPPPGAGGQGLARLAELLAGSRVELEGCHTLASARNSFFYPSPR